MHTKMSILSLKQQIDDNPILYKTVGDVWKAWPGISRSSTEKYFKSVTGYRIKEYLVKVRLEHTKQLLREGMPINRVASKCFYKSQSAYCTAFRRLFHQSPTDWLNEEQQ